ncbi:MAG: MFS transporter [Acidobacteria bacterium]|nr:MFS transporter [Acidobacteriota bacterium]MCL5744957.1 MFS transporter [Acidobacteriota bacterium]
MTGSRFVFLRLSALMFLEFFTWGAWIVPISSYMNATLGFSGTQIGWICAASGLGALGSPLFIGYVADRYFATERILGALHFAGAVCLFLAAGQTTFPSLMTLIVLDALCFMPTLPLANNMAFRNIADADRYPRIAVGGNVGWVVSGLLVGIFLGEKTGGFFYFAAAAEAVLAAYCFTLPHTPPKRAEAAPRDVFGLSAAKLLRQPAFLVFAIAIPLVTISKTFYTTWTNAFLSEIRMPKPTAVMTLAQISEVIAMILMPWFIAKIGLKRVLAFGMAAFAVRYFAFATMHAGAVIGGLLLHGFSYGFVVAGASIYAARVAPPGMSARAQSFIALLIFGIGMFAGAQVAGFTGQQYQPDGAGIHGWTQIWSWAAALAIAACVLFWAGGKDPQPVAE